MEYRYSLGILLIVLENRLVRLQRLFEESTALVDPLSSRSFIAALVMTEIWGVSNVVFNIELAHNRDWVFHLT